MSSRNRLLVLVLGTASIILAALLAFAFVSHFQQPTTEKVVVVRLSITGSTVINVADISTDFTVESLAVSRVPSGAYIYTSQAALDTFLNQSAVLQQLNPGHILLVSDPQLLIPSQIPTPTMNPELP
jgi:hypothetical protein